MFVTIESYFLFHPSCLHSTLQNWRSLYSPSTSEYCNPCFRAAKGGNVRSCVRVLVTILFFMIVHWCIDPCSGYYLKVSHSLIYVEARLMLVLNPVIFDKFSSNLCVRV
jgi:hypothetical protein